jgi:hypothetical protein
VNDAKSSPIEQCPCSKSLSTETLCPIKAQLGAHGPASAVQASARDKMTGVAARRHEATKDVQTVITKGRKPHPTFKSYVFQTSPITSQVLHHARSCTLVASSSLQSQRPVLPGHCWPSSPWQFVLFTSTWFFKCSTRKRPHCSEVCCPLIASLKRLCHSGADNLSSMHGRVRVTGICCTKSNLSWIMKHIA